MFMDAIAALAMGLCPSRQMDVNKYLHDSTMKNCNDLHCRELLLVVFHRI